MCEDISFFCADGRAWFVCMVGAEYLKRPLLSLCATGTSTVIQKWAFFVPRPDLPLDRLYVFEVSKSLKKTKSLLAKKGGSGGRNI